MSTIFWDFDGTLVYSHHLWSGSMYTALTAIAPRTLVTFEQIRECNRRGFTWQTPSRDHTALVRDAWWHHIESHAFSVYVSCGESEQIAATAASLVRKIILSPERYHLYPDTLNVLKQCRLLGHRNVILSNNYPELHDIAEALGLFEYIDGMVVSALEGYDKPRSELFDIARSRFPDTSHYMIGDNPSADIRGGNQAGMTTILVHSPASPSADFHAPTLTDVLSIIKAPLSN